MFLDSGNVEVNRSESARLRKSKSKTLNRQSPLGKKDLQAEVAASFGLGSAFASAWLAEKNIK